MGPSLDTSILKAAYSQGIFPMDYDGEVVWSRPRRRALLPIEGIHVSRSLARTLRQGRFEITFDQAFRDVMLGCQDRAETWISDDFIEAYSQCREEGWGHSCEAWVEGRLAGGVYGLAVGGVFCGESMFSRERDASKAALKALVDRCRELGFRVFDCQIINPHTESLGAYEVPGALYGQLLASLLHHRTEWSWIPDA